MISDSSSFKHLPYKQQLALKYKGKLAPLVKKFPVLFTCFSDKTLAGNIPDVLKKTGFECHSIVSSDNTQVSKNLFTNLDKGYLALLQYQPPPGRGSLVTMLKGLSLILPDEYLERVIPLMIAQPSLKKQQEIFQILGNYNVRYALFLSPNAGVERNYEELFEGLTGICGLMKNLPVAPEAKKAPGPDTGQTEKYQSLIAIAEKAMTERKYQEAIDAFSIAINIGSNYELLIERGDAYYSLMDYLHALKDYREAALLKKSSAEPYAKVGLCCFSMLKTKKGKKDLKDVQRIVLMGLTNLESATSTITRMEEELGQNETMLKDPYRNVVKALAEIDSDDLGFVQGAGEQVDGLTRAVLEKTGSVNCLDSSTNLDFRINRATLLARQGEYSMAEKIFRLVAKEDPTKAGPVFNNFANELNKAKEHGRAFMIFVELMQYDLGNEGKQVVIENLKQTGLILARNFREEGDYKKAKSAYKKVMSYRPKKREFVLCEMAMMDLELQNQAGAASRLTEALYINPKLTLAEEFAEYGDLANLAKEIIKKIKEAFFGEDIR